VWTNDNNWSEGKDGDDADADPEEEGSTADDGLLHHVEDWEHSTRECEDWTVYFRPVKCDNSEGNKMANDVSYPKTVL